LFVKRKELETLLSKIESYLRPKLSLEQYTTPPQLVAILLQTAAYTFNDIIGKRVCDLGCGVGRLSIAAAYLGAGEVLGIDIDKEAVHAAKDSAERLGLNIGWVAGDIEALVGTFDTVIQNPPFGVRSRGTDVKFLRKAFELGGVVYSIHKSGESNRKYLTKVAEGSGRKAKVLAEARFEIPHQFEFHRKPKYEVKVDLYRIAK